MKNMIKLPAVILGLLLLFTGTTQKAMAQDEDISLETFYEELAPFGTWFQDPQYGYVWRPDVDQSNFRPYYTDGRWAMTEYGNTWVSDYEWGWAPFHYGRWVLNQYHEWIWIPDTVWGPAWVSWRSGGGYYGWAPLSPGFDFNVGFGGGYSIPNDWWVFIPQINIYSSNYPRYYSRSNSFFNRTTYINYTYGGRGRTNYYTGPRAGDIRRVTNRDVTVYNINRSNRPGRTSISNNNINIYNPRGGGRPSNNNGPGNAGRPGNNNGQGNGRPGQPDRNNSGSNGRPGNAGRPGNNDNGQGNGRPGQPDRNNGGSNGRPGNAGRPGNNDNGQGNGRPASSETGTNAPGQPARPGRDNNNMQRPPENRRGGQDRVQNMQRDDQQRQQQDQQRQQREGQQRQEQQQRQQQDQQRQQREGQQRQEQQQRQQQDQQRQQREGQQRQEQQQRQQQDQQRQQREGQQRQEQQQRQQQDQQRQQQQARPARTEGQTTPPPANTESSRRSRGGGRG